VAKEVWGQACRLGADWRECLGWPDGAIAQTPDALRSAVDLIRRARPRAIAVPYWDDRHPDHVASSHALRQAVFTSGLRRYESAAEPWRPDWICYYFINDGVAPSFVVDVSAHYEKKRQALACYASQFVPSVNAIEYPMRAHNTPTNPSEMKLIIIVLSAFFERTSPP